MRSLVGLTIGAVLALCSACSSSSYGGGGTSASTTTASAAAPSTAAGSPGTGPGSNSTTSAPASAALTGALPEIEAIEWRADSVTVGTDTEPAPSNGAGFVIDTNGNISLNTGCNTASGTVTASAPHVMTIGPLAMTRKACVDQKSQDFENLLLTLFSGDVAWNGNGATLTVNSVDDPDPKVNFANEGPAA